MRTCEKRTFRLDKFPEYTLQKNNAHPFQKTRENTWLKECFIYLIILSYIFSFTIINCFLNVLGCTNAHCHSGIHIVWWTRSTHTERSSSQTRTICNICNYMKKNSYKDNFNLFNMIMDTYLNKQWKCLHAAASRAKFIRYAHS